MVGGPLGAWAAAVGAVGALLLLRAWWRWAARQRALQRCAERIPGPRPLPLIGNVLDLGLNTKDFLPIGVALVKKYGYTLRFWAGPQLLIFVSDPKDLESILNSTKNITKSFNYSFLYPWLGQGLLTSTGDRWRKHRKIITPTFHFKILEEFNSVFNAQGDTLVEILKGKAGQGSFDVTPLIESYTQDVICETAMGIQLHAQQEGTSSAYLRAVKDQCEILTSRSAQPWYYVDFLFNISPIGRRQKRNLKILHDLTAKVIAEKKKILKTNSQEKEKALMVDEMGVKRRLAFLDYLLLASEDGSVLTDEDIREEVDTFMFEGHDTTSSAIGFTIYELSKRPEIQEEVYRELVEVFGKQHSDADFTTDLGQLSYLDRVIKETLRMYPSVPILGREITHPIRLPSLDAELIPGVTVVIAPVLMHHNPEHFPNPDDFDPDNFLPEKVAERHPFTFLPFSAGSRNCIGQKFAMLEMKSIISKLVWNFVIQLESGFVPKVVPEITLKSWNGIRISITPRKR